MSVILPKFLTFLKFMLQTVSFPRLYKGSNEYMNIHWYHKLHGRNNEPICFIFLCSTSLEYLYSPISSRAIDDREVVRQTFENLSSTDFDPFSQTEIIQQSEVIFRSIDEKAIFTDSVLLELNVSWFLPSHFLIEFAPFHCQSPRYNPSILFSILKSKYMRRKASVHEIRRSVDSKSKEL